MIPPSNNSNSGIRMLGASYEESVKSNSFKLDKIGSKPNLNEKRQSVSTPKLSRFDCLSCGGKKCTSIQIKSKPHNINREGIITCDICSTNFSTILRADDSAEHMMLYWKAASSN